MALRGVGPESEAESVRFHGRRVTKVGPEVKHGFRGLRGRTRKFSITNPQQVFPLAKIAFEFQALRNLEARDDAPLDLLAGLPGSFARSTIPRYSAVFRGAE